MYNLISSCVSCRANWNIKVLGRNFSNKTLFYFNLFFFFFKGLPGVDGREGIPGMPGAKVRHSWHISELW